MSTITIEDYKQWLRLPQTEDFIVSLSEKRKDLMERMLIYKGDDHQQLIGMILCIDSILHTFEEKTNEEAANI